MSEQAQVGDTVRLTIEGKVHAGGGGWVAVNGTMLYLHGRTVEILSRALPPLPDEPGTFWLDRDGDVWKVESDGELRMVTAGRAAAANYAPFRQLVLK